MLMTRTQLELAIARLEADSQAIALAITTLKALRDAQTPALAKGRAS
jgi:hypothetical protein